MSVNHKKTDGLPIYYGNIKLDMVLDLREKIISAIEKRKIYREKNYPVKQLATDLGTNTRYVSTVINVSFGMNYTSLINKYRIEEAITILNNEKYRNLRVEDVSDMVGFSNRQSFYTSFQRVTGMTPKTYKRLNQPSGDLKKKKK